VVEKRNLVPSLPYKVLQKWLRKEGDSLLEKSEKGDTRSDHEERQGTRRGEKKAPEGG